MRRAWSVCGGFELSGHLHNTVTDYAAYFDAAIRISAQYAGLAVPGS